MSPLEINFRRRDRNDMVPARTARIKELIPRIDLGDGPVPEESPRPVLGAPRGMIAWTVVDVLLCVVDVVALIVVVVDV